MVLGNHEFDWGLDVVTGYFDGNTENGEASFPLLGANVFYQGTTNIVEHIDPYTIIERDGIQDWHHRDNGIWVRTIHCPK